MVEIFLKSPNVLKDTMNNILVQDTVSRIPNFESKVFPIPQKIRTYLGLDGLFFWVSLRDTMNNILVQDTVSRIPNFESKVIPIPQKIRTYLGLDGLFFGVSLRDTMKNILVQDTNSNPMCNFPTSIDLKLLLDLYHSYYFQPLN